METLQDIQDRLKIELKLWLTRQVNNPYEDYYLYYIESTPEHDGGIIIAVDPPANKNYKMAGAGRINKGATIEANFTILQDTIRRLPVLSIKKYYN